MTEKILVAVDGSDQSYEALEYAVETFPGAEITALYVIDLPDVVDPSEAADNPVYSDRVARAEAVLEKAESIGNERGGNVSIAQTADRPDRGITEYAETNGFDHIVVGSHGRTGAARILLGSIAERVVRRSSTPVTVVR